MSTATRTPLVITDEQKRQFRELGFFVLENVMSEDDLELLRGECARQIVLTDALMDEQGVDKLGLNHRNKRYFFNVFQRDRESILKKFLFNDLTADICAAILGDNAYLFNEQFVVKAAEQGMEFSWHQDSGYIGYPHTPYFSLWCALDDVSEENGTVYMLPFEKAGTREMQLHSRDEKSNDLVGYLGDEPGIPVIAPAGSIAVFSSTTFHRSGFNGTSKMRRVYLTQYSPEPIMRPDNSGHWGMAEPLIIDGKRVNDGS